LKGVAKVFNLVGSEKYSREETADVAADGVTRSITIPEPADISATYFLRLQLFSLTGDLLSNNFYWLSSKPDELDFSKTEWYYTPQTSFADLSALQDLPKARVHAILRTAKESERDATFVVGAENTSSNVAFLTRFRLVNRNDQREILPVFWQDNYISLLPGEKRELTVKLRKADLAGFTPRLLVDGFNTFPFSSPQ
jgi:exo-1,4-beta-D-glucosaminidase